MVRIFSAQPFTKGEDFPQWFLEVMRGHECKPVKIFIRRFQLIDVLSKLEIQSFYLFF
jgi:hypothetical protein